MAEMIRRLTEAVERTRMDSCGSDEEIVEATLHELEEPTSGMVFGAVGEIILWADKVARPGAVSYVQAAQLARKVWRTMVEQARQGSLADTPEGMRLIFDQSMKVKLDV